jgi:hypothetical protein
VEALPPYNRYAPPADHAPRLPLPARARRGFEEEHRSLLGHVVLMVVTLGLYGSIWLFRRRAFLNSLDSWKKLPAAYPVLRLSFTVISWLCASKALGLGDFAAAASAMAGLATLVANFRVAHILRSAFARSAIQIPVSAAATLFFGTLYLQWALNRAAGWSLRSGGRSSPRSQS